MVIIRQEAKKVKAKLKCVHLTRGQLVVKDRCCCNRDHWHHEEWLKGTNDDSRTGRINRKRKVSTWTVINLVKTLMQVNGEIELGNETV